MTRQNIYSNVNSWNEVERTNRHTNTVDVFTSLWNDLVELYRVYCGVVSSCAHLCEYTVCVPRSRNTTSAIHFDDAIGIGHTFDTVGRFAFVEVDLVVCKNLKDTIPKLIGNFLIADSKNDLHFVLFNSVCSNNDLVEKFSEPKSTVDEREKLEKMIEVLNCRAKM